MAYKQFLPAQVLTASETQTYLMNQSVMVFATSAARTSALTIPSEGMTVYLQDSNSFQFYDGSAWVNLGNVMRFASSAVRATILTSPVEGMMAYLQDTDELQVYNGSSWLTVVVTSDDEGITTAGNFFANTGKFVANRASATSASNAGGIDMQIDGTTYGQIFMTNSTQMRFTSALNSFDGSVSIFGAQTTLAGPLTVNNGGVDGGLVLRPWTASGAYVSLATRDMAGAEYMVLSNGLDTFLSAGAGGSTHLRGGNNGFGNQVVASPTAVTVNGNLLLPNMPCSYATNSNSYTVTDNQTLRFDIVHVNRGGHYNGTNSEFTAPLAGMYFVHCQVLTQYNATASDLRIAKNNVRVDAYSGYSLVGGVLSSHKQGHVQGIVSCNAGEYISIKAVGTIDFYGSTVAGHSSLLIHFLG